MLVLLLALPALAGGPLLTIDGECPRLDIDVTGLTPGGSYSFLLGLSTGADTMGFGPCTGTVTGMAGLWEVARGRDDDGMLRLSPRVPPSTCDRLLQVLDHTTCLLTEAVPFTPADSLPCSEQAQIWCLENGYTEVDFIGDGNLLCTSPSVGPGSDCNACESGWATLVWRTDDISPYGCGTFPMTAGRRYAGHSPCSCDAPLLDCGTWDMAGCIPD